jgi:hypothetical protein
MVRSSSVELDSSDAAIASHSASLILSESILKVVNVAFLCLSALTIFSLPPSGKEHSWNSREVNAASSCNALAVISHRALVKQKRKNSTDRKEGARNNSVMLWYFLSAHYFMAKKNRF